MRKHATGTFEIESREEKPLDGHEGVNYQFE